MRWLVILSVFFVFTPHVLADELHLVVNGKSIHFDDRNQNEENWGLGVEYNFTPRKSWVTLINASYFKDSSYNTSRYIGGGMKRRYWLNGDNEGWFADLGAVAFLMTRKDYKNNEPFPGILPFASVGHGPVTLNMTYIPSVSPKHSDLLYFQLMIRVATFN